MNQGFLSSGYSRLKQRTSLIWLKCYDIARCNNTYQISQQYHICNMVSFFIDQRLHLRSSLTAAVPSGFHRHRKVICPAKCRNKKRNKQRYQAFCFLDQSAALKIGTSCHLSFHDLVCLIEQDRDKTKCDGHHHGYLMHRNFDDFQRGKGFFQSVRQIIRCRSQRQH